MPIHWKGNAMTLGPVDSAQGAQRLSTPEANALVISLLGGFQARVGASTIHLPTRKTQALLAYLALHPGHPHDREKIQGLLWPDAPPRQAQASLRQTLFTLRKTLPGTSAAALLTTATTVALDASHLTVDVAILERHVGGVTREALEGVASLYAGHLLEAFVIDEAPFDRWIESERSRLREVALGTLERLLDLQAAAGEPEKAIQTALHSLRLDPLRESTHRALMQLYAASGRRGAAVQQYRSLVSALAQELDVEPDSQTKRLHDDILRLDSAGVGPKPASSPRPPSADARPRSGPAPTALRHLIGRDAEMARIHQALDDAWSGTGKLSLLSGDTGVGKTRILEEVATRALGRGGRVLRGRCFESEEVLPFAVWADLLRGDTSLASPVSLASEAFWSRLPPACAAPLAQLLPRPGEASSHPQPAMQDPRALFDAVAGVLTLLAREAPLLVVVDDLQWSDTMSLRLLSFLLRRLAPSPPVCFIAAVRAEELAAAPFLRTVLQELEREQRFLPIEIAPLTRADSKAFVQALAQSSVAVDPASVFEPIWALSEGNPLVIVETVRGLEAGPLPTGGTPLPVPARIRERIQRHLAPLDALAQEALATAAVIGREFDFALLHVACACPPRKLATTLDELVRMRILTGTGDAFYFTHDRVREVVSGSLSPQRRKVLQDAVAHARAYFVEELRMLGWSR
ncbi:MAG TPA: AAA family ATPase [Polyangiaceae bacterium]|nr:AAA family ATPase [Polyangiaceae bacterium]